MCSSLYYLLQTLHRIKPVHFDKVPFDDQYAPDARPLVVLSDMLVAWTTFLIGSSVVANIIRSHDSLYAHWCCNLGHRRHIISEGMYLKKLLEPLLLSIRTCLRPALNRCVRWCSVVNEMLLLWWEWFTPCGHSSSSGKRVPGRARSGQLWPASAGIPPGHSLPWSACGRL